MVLPYGQRESMPEALEPDPSLDFSRQLYIGAIVCSPLEGFIFVNWCQCIEL